jgi:ketosteroid isomerase-like protein
MDLDDTIAAYHQALDAIVTGDAGPLQELYSRADDGTLSNPWGPTQRGWADVSSTLERAGSQFRDGGPRPEGHAALALHRASDLACLVENEHWQAKVSGGDELSPFDLRVTTVFRLEGDGWKVVHRHADPITLPNPKGVLGRPT